ncbi:MAG TPA: hypothetical protein VFS08_10425 [Gemmatimonadaceae bacterium]|nr:hypothetical protein [Gemmatimonadaceae bacterium]
MSIPRYRDPSAPLAERQDAAVAALAEKLVSFGLRADVAGEYASTHRDRLLLAGDGAVFTTDRHGQVLRADDDNPFHELARQIVHGAPADAKRGTVYDAETKASIATSVRRRVAARF